VKTPVLETTAAPDRLDRHLHDLGTMEWTGPVYTAVTRMARSRVTDGSADYESLPPEGGIDPAKLRVGET
jgi:hypothetical protein